MNLKEFSGYCFDEIGAQKGYTRYRNSWYKLENEILLGFGMRKMRGPVFDIVFESMPLVCGVNIDRTGQMNYMGISLDGHRKYESIYTDFQDMAYREWAREYAVHVFEQSIEPLLDGVHDLATAYEMHWAYKRLWDPTYYELKDATLEKHIWLYLCALKRYDAALLNAKRCAEMKGLPELDERFEFHWKIQNLLRDKDYAAIEAILEQNKQKSLALLKKHRIFR